MITSDLVEYIKLQLNKNIPKNLIVSQLSQVGWREEDIEEGFLTVDTETVSEEKKIEEIQKDTKIINEEIKNKEVDKTNIQKTIDPYRELPEDVESVETENYTPYIANKIEHKIESKQEEIIQVEKPKKIEEEIVFSSEKDIEPYRLEVEEGVKPNTITSGGDMFKIQGQDINKQKITTEGVQKEDEVAISNDNTSPIKIWTPSVIEPKQQQEKVIPLIETQTTEEPLIKSKDISVSDEFIPTINKVQPVINTIQIPSLPPLKPRNDEVKNVQKGMSDIVQKSAMLSSYSQDILIAKKDEVNTSIKKNSYLKIMIIIFILIIIGGMVFAFIEGYIKVPWSNINFTVVKKDPKTIILNTPSNLSKLKSYKTETNISISSPTISSITTGLSSGDASFSKDRDSISFNTKGVVSHLENKLIYDYSLDLKSSLLEKDINSNIKYDGTGIHLLIPELNSILGENAPTPTTVFLKPNQIELIVPEFSNKIQDKIKEFDIYNIKSGEIPVYVKSETNLIFKEFIGKLEYIEKENENIHGVETYHYELIAGRQLTKKFLTSIANLFIGIISPEQKKILEEALGSSTISSFEVWVGKNDDNLYQIKFTLNTPLSQVLSLNDSGIAGNEVKLDWITTFYDLDVPNNIIIPDAELDMPGFIKNIRDIKIKNLISSFKDQAVTFKNAVGSYGSRSNPAGSCSNPNPGSIFSPQGHNKGAATSVGIISSSMNSLLQATNGSGSCYSTSQAWALSAPLLTNTDDGTQDYYCTDSINNTLTLKNPITGTVCK